MYAGGQLDMFSAFGGEDFSNEPIFAHFDEFPIDEILTFEKEVDLSAGETENRSVAFSNLCSTVTEVKINGADAGTVMWQPYEVNALNLLRQGKNSIEITVTGNLRNLLGPHHLSEGECFAVAPRKFFHNSPIWSKGQNPDWVDSYCFVEFGLFFK